MRRVKWILVVLLICSLTALVEKDKPTGGLSEGDIAPDFKIKSTSNGQPASKLGNLKGKYVSLSFWTGYGAQSRVRNVNLSNTLRSFHNVEMVSISSSEYQLVFKETIRKDQIVMSAYFVETEGEDSGLFREYRSNRGFTNCLLDGNGVTITKNIFAADLSAYIREVG